MHLYTARQLKIRNAAVFVFDFSILREQLIKHMSLEEILMIWRGIILDYQIKMNELQEYTTCMWTLPDKTKYSKQEISLFNEMMLILDQLPSNSFNTLFKLGKNLAESKYFKQITFISMLTPSLPAMIIRDAQEWLWEVEFVLGPDTNTSLYMICYRESEIDDILRFDWQSPELFLETAEFIRSKGRQSQPLIYWKQLKDFNDLEYSYQFFAALACITPKFNGFDGFNTWDAMNKLTDCLGFRRSLKFRDAYPKKQ